MPNTPTNVRYYTATATASNGTTIRQKQQWQKQQENRGIVNEHYHTVSRVSRVAHMWPLRRPRFVLILVQKINNGCSITMMKELGHSLIDACYHSTASSHTKQLLEVKKTLLFGGDIS